ncbi:MAG: multidrug efflux SMR transporter [Coriobacteriia bacterium]|nr:multidrug efflux SMR transporter [Coriobacteriia bacterium]
MKRTAYLYLAGAIVFELFGTTCLKACEGFTIPIFCVGVAVGYLVSLSLMVYALRDLPLGLTYGIWGGVGTIAVAFIGLIGWGEPFTPIMFGGIALIVAGIVLLNQGTEELEAQHAQSSE